ncbi:hypothetical protein EDD36DRAFT_104983 [Exophiala viscosa]|uniref:Uncharacterized protein n=1 Tax=Exophiala viscosa TaxID=2486360 RepID=A0AAN6DMT1_9EURO|nr:hypothetical protein EDD36DRAFT_104983 [Exophiala viscosa]
MTQLWPPSPSVEDEDVALAKEQVVGVPSNKLKTENQPAGSRGSVDQYPIILDHDGPDTDFTQTLSVHPECEPGSDSVDLSREKPANFPVGTNPEKRFILVPAEQLAKAEDAFSETLHRSKSFTPVDDCGWSRERPQVARINTDLSNGLDGMTPGRQRQPSPYTRNPAEFVASTGPPQAGATLLSPMDAYQPRRSISVHQTYRSTPHDSSDTDHTLSSRRKHERSTSRAHRQSFSHYDLSETEKERSPTLGRRRHSRGKSTSRPDHHHRNPAPSQNGFSDYSYTSQEHITPPQSPKLSAALARSPVSARPSGSHGHAARYDHDRVITDSPYASSAEEGRLRTHGSEGERRSTREGRSRRSSHARRDKSAKPHMSRAPSHRRHRDSKDESNRGLGPSDERRGDQTPLSGQSPRVMEDYFEKAFMANQTKNPSYAQQQSRAVSPLASPPDSPPRTPRNERPQRDHLGSSFNASNTSKPRTRPPSMDDSHPKDLKPLTSLLSAATLGATVAGKTIPSHSRSSTSLSTLGTPSSGSQTRPSSGQRSQRHSPVPDDTPTITHSLSRTNSLLAGDDGTSIRTMTYTVQQDRTLPRTSAYLPAPVESPRTATRAASYSFPPESPRPMPLYRAMSSVSTQSYQQSVHPPTQRSTMSRPVTPAPEQVPVFAAAPLRPAAPPLCPRSTPVSGLHDWYTIRDMPYLDFCPTCMSFLGATRFRDHFIPSMSRDPRQPVMCAMNRPWVRLAWMQSIKHDKKDLHLVWDMSTPPPQETKPCAGSKPDLRKWHHLEDPRTKRPIDGFDICSACVRNIDIVFPKLRSRLFDRPSNKPNQEKICGLNISSKHFWSLLAELERLAERWSREHFRQKDVQDFADYVRRISRHRECAKNNMLGNVSWHFIPELPEFTICEECYEEVVWPIRDRPIAKDVSRTLKLVPNLRRSHSVPGTSCQLYSDRMRRIFHEAVSKNDFEGLKTAAKQRISTEHWLWEMNKLYEADQRRGIDRRTELENNNSIWRSIE